LDLIPIYAKIVPTDPSLVPTNIPSDSDLPASFLVNAPDDFDFAASLILLSETKQLDLTSRFRRDADAYYVEAKRSTVSSVAQIPYWMYGVLVVLGWNEAMMVIFNPLYFALLLGILGGSWVIVQLNLVGPLFAVGRTVTGEACPFCSRLVSLGLFLRRFNGKSRLDSKSTFNNPSTCLLHVHRPSGSLRR